jgi:hypothetical protein
MYGDIEQAKKDANMTPEKLGLGNETELDQALTAWLTQFNSDMNTYLNEGEIPDSDSRKAGLDGIANRLLMKMYGYALQMRSSPVVQLGDFNIQMVDPGAVTRDLERQLLPYQRTHVDISASSDIAYTDL